MASLSNAPSAAASTRDAQSVARYLRTYLEPAPVQEPAAAGTDPQLSTVMLTLVQWLRQTGSHGVIIDIGCGKGTLLQRLIEDVGLKEGADWIYGAVDSDENLDEVQRIARSLGCSRRVEPLNLSAFYSAWPILANPQLIFCRNVIHELNIRQTAQLLSHVASNISDADTAIFQDLMNFPEGERHNACWFPEELRACLHEHGFTNIVWHALKSKSGAQWFNITANAPPRGFAFLSPDASLRSVIDARHRQWLVWSAIDGNGAQGQADSQADSAQVLRALDLDVQLAALTRQLRDVGKFFELEKSVEKRLRSRELSRRVEAFVSAGKLDVEPIHERVRLRERGEQLSLLEEFLRGASRLAIVCGGVGTGKTTLVQHLLATRSYAKSAIILDAHEISDLWSLIETLFSKAGLRLSSDILSVLHDLHWEHIEIPLRQFVNKFLPRIILFIDDLDKITDSNNALNDADVAKALRIIASVPGCKLLVAQRDRSIPNSLCEVSGTLNPLVVRVGRYATDQVVTNILDDYFDRASACLDSYPERLIHAVDRHPLGTMLCGEILRRHGLNTLLEDRFFAELEQRLYRELWARLVDESCIDAVTMASELRVAVPKFMLEDLSSAESVTAALANAAVYVFKDRRWEQLISALVIFRRRRIDDPPDDTPEKDLHDRIADYFLSLYHRDDDPKWIRESYFHRMLSGEANSQIGLGNYYRRELLASANYCFLSQRDYREALNLYNAALRASDLPEESLMHRASCLIRIGERKEGETEYRRLFAVYTANVGIRTSFVDALLYVRDYHAARDALTDLKLAPEQSDWVTGQWGRTLLGLHKYRDAEAMFRKQLAAKQIPDAQVFIHLARSLQYQGALSESLRVLERGIRWHPDSLSMKMALGAALERVRDDDRAVMLLEPLFQVRPDLSPVALTLTKIFGRTDRLREARMTFERAKKRAVDAEDNVLVTIEAELLKAEGRPDAAIELLKQHDQRDPHVLGMVLECTFHYAQSKQSDERARIAQDALSLEIPQDLMGNMPLLVNRGRLAALAGSRLLFERLILDLRNSRLEESEITSLERAWMTFNDSI